MSNADITDRTWCPTTPDVAAFLKDFDSQGRSNDGSAAQIFAETFLALDPARAITLTPAMLAAALPARRRMFDEAGVGDLHRVDARQLHLDDRHVLVNARWNADRVGAAPLALSSTFLLRRQDDRFEVVVYINHTDLTSALAPTHKENA